MSGQLGNLAFALLFLVLGSGALAAVFWFLYRAAAPYFGELELNPAIVRRALFLVWVALTALAGWGTVQSNAPRITIDDYTKPPDYEAGPVRDLNPHQKTDAERVEENRKLFDENAVGK